MRQLAYILAGAFFGIVLYKGEVISWFRIQEMFRFHGFHMYGVLFSGVAVAAVFLLILKAVHARAAGGGEVAISPKPLNRGTWIGGTIFGMGWALTGACPGPLYVHLGAGTTVMIVAIASALVGVWTYAILKPRLPH